MLNSLYIENIAVIEKVSIDFSKGFQVLTGETGAGKSMIIDAIHALLGHRTSKEIIRTGAEYAFVSGSFSELHSNIKNALNELGFECDDDELLLQRRINISGKNICKINGKPATLSMLKEVAENLINIHGQHESYQLMLPEKHVLYLDSMGKLQPDIDAYRAVFHLLKDCKRKLEAKKENHSERERKIDLLRYQLEELEQANLQPNEYESLTAQRDLALNQERINQSLESSYSLLKGDDEKLGAIEDIENAVTHLGIAAEFLPKAEQLANRVNTLFYELQDCAGEISALTDTIEGDQYSLSEIESRLDVLYKLSRKYGETTEEMLSFLEQTKRELKELENYEEGLQTLESNFEQFYEQSKALAKVLYEKRMQAAEMFTQNVQEEMQFLNMPNVRLKIDRQQGPLSENGYDKIEFLISTNPGEPPKPVSKIASGGELSRMMLAIKNVLSDSDIAETLIFDEVDAGISGSAAQKVGLKLKSLSKAKQVICVTHQAQIAALADNHYLISKTVKENKTYTLVTPLEFEQRKQELARIIGGVHITQLTLQHAEEMLNSAKEEI